MATISFTPPPFNIGMVLCNCNCCILHRNSVVYLLESKSHLGTIVTSENRFINTYSNITRSRNPIASLQRLVPNTSVVS